jgi:AhpD family alkylhydroperoxidase
MQARMKSPALTVPDALSLLLKLEKAAEHAELPFATRKLVQLRASQINGCSLCIDMHAHELKKAGESDERIWGVAGWREAPFYSDAERAALRLAEAATRLSDRDEAVSDDIWAEATQHYGPDALAALLLEIAMINLWNRLNVSTRQPANAWRAPVRA